MASRDGRDGRGRGSGREQGGGARSGGGRGNAAGGGRTRGGAGAQSDAGGRRTELPVRGTISSGFGPRNHPVKGGPGTHKGVDIPVRVNTPVRATGGGVVIRAGWE